LWTSPEQEVGGPTTDTADRTSLEAWGVRHGPPGAFIAARYPAGSGVRPGRSTRRSPLVTWPLQGTVAENADWGRRTLSAELFGYLTPVALRDAKARI
jgi:hypothetical protein